MTFQQRYEALEGKFEAQIDEDNECFWWNRGNERRRVRYVTRWNASELEER